MDFKEIQELIKLINKSNLTEFKMQDGEFSLSIRTKKYIKGKQAQIVQPQQQILPVQAPISTMQVQPLPQSAASVPSAPNPQPAPAAAPTEEKSNEDKYIEIRSPIVGTFYRSSSPDKPPYIKVGDMVETGQIVCIIEAMKLFNEIESEVSGRIVEVMVDDATPVEFDQVLFKVEA
ncbi:MAG: acetyl-CoA carboxylase biotin carboxyl carrier protein [Bacteroidota bacterium]